MKNLSPIFDVLSKILALVLVAVFIVLLADAKWPFLAEVPTLYNVFKIMKEFGALLLVALVGMEAICKCNHVIRLIYYVCIAIIVIFLFFPSTYEGLIGLI